MFYCSKYKVPLYVKKSDKIVDHHLSAEWDRKVFLASSFVFTLDMPEQWNKISEKQITYRTSNYYCWGDRMTLVSLFVKWHVPPLRNKKRAKVTTIYAQQSLTSIVLIGRILGAQIGLFPPSQIVHVEHCKNYKRWGRKVRDDKWEGTGKESSSRLCCLMLDVKSPFFKISDAELVFSIVLHGSWQIYFRMMQRSKSVPLW